MAGGLGKKRTRSEGAAGLALEGGEGEEEGDGGGGGGGGGEEEEDGFYAAAAAAAAAKKARKLAQRQAARESSADFIRARPLQAEVAGGEGGAPVHRPASKQIMVNRGLVKYRNSETSNPRVAYRRKAEKKMKRRVGAAAPMRDKSGEADAYGGEKSGIRVNISKSRLIKG
jgi:hypothetical protein